EVRETCQLETGTIFAVLPPTLPLCLSVHTRAVVSWRKLLAITSGARFNEENHHPSPSLRRTEIGEADVFRTRERFLPFLISYRGSDHEHQTPASGPVVPGAVAGLRHGNSNRALCRRLRRRPASGRGGPGHCRRLQSSGRAAHLPGCDEGNGS